MYTYTCTHMHIYVVYMLFGIKVWTVYDQSHVEETVIRTMDELPKLSSKLQWKLDSI